MKSTLVTDAFERAGKLLSARKNGDRGRAPEMPGGLPWLGHALEFWRHPIELLTRGRERFGEVWRFKLAGKEVTVLTGPKANLAFFHAPPDVLSARECYQFTVPVFGQGVAYDVPTEVMDQQLGWVHPALSERRLRTYARVMAEEADSFLDGWGERGELDLFDATNQLTTFIATRCLLGDEFRTHLTADFARMYHDLDRGMSLLAYFAPHAPLPAFKKRDRAREEVSRLLSGVMRARHSRQDSAVHEDFLQTLMDARYEDGASLPDPVISGLLLTLIFAGQHTSAVLAAWTGILLHQNPRFLPPLVGELDELLGGGAELTFECIRRMTLLERAVKEAERMRPPLVMLMRAVLKDMDYMGFTLPPGSLAMVSPAVSHRLAEVFTHPQKYDPDRFAPGREEDRKVQYSLLGFGGGKHRCIGMVFAYQQIKVIWASILRRYQIELVEREYLPNYTTFVVGPHRPCTIRYRRRQRAVVGAGSSVSAGVAP
ncbi:MAG TPA: cytochrome P450 [Polyangiaceae bacterium]